MNSDANMDTDLLFGSGLSLFGHQRLRGCLNQFLRFINASYSVTYFNMTLATKRM